MLGTFKFAKKLCSRRAPTPTWAHSQDCTNTCNYQSPLRYKALLIGINYKRPRDQRPCIPDTPPGFKWPPLSGCHNDVERVRKLLTDTYACNDFTVMLDNDSNRKTNLYPTRKNILWHLKKLIAGAQPGDAFILFFAGHSDQKKALVDKREKDGMDEYIVSVDGLTILDDLLRRILVDPLPAGCRLVAVFDSCHSGTLLDLQEYDDPEASDRHTLPSTSTFIEQEGKALMKRLSVPEELISSWRVVKKSTRVAWKHLVYVATFCLRVRVVAKQARARSASEVQADLPTQNATPPSPAAPQKKPCKACEMGIGKKTVLSISSCQDGQITIEVKRKRGGVFTQAFCEVLANKPELSGDELGAQLRNKVFHDTAKVFCNMRMRARAASAPEVRASLLQKLKGKIAAFNGWQHVSVGWEHNESLGEPFLPLPQAASRK